MVSLADDSETCWASGRGCVALKSVWGLFRGLETNCGSRGLPSKEVGVSLDLFVACINGQEYKRCTGCNLHASNKNQFAEN